MSASIDQFRELLDAEDFVDMAKLADCARHGIPEKIRGEVWSYLLEVSKPDKAEESKHERKQIQEYVEIDKSNSAEIKKKIRQQIKRAYPKITLFHEEVVQTKMENILSAYMNYNAEIEYSPSYITGMICLLGPLVYSLKKDYDIFWCFQTLMKKLEQYLAEDSITDKMSRIMMYLRSVQPELFNYFEEEELSPNDWAMSWLSFLLAKELPLECTLRLWDTYFSYPDGFSLHIFVCVAILVNCSESLMELDISELKSFLQRLPFMDMDEVIKSSTFIFVNLKRLYHKLTMYVMK